MQGECSYRAWVKSAKGGDCNCGKEANFRRTHRLDCPALPQMSGAPVCGKPAVVTINGRFYCSQHAKAKSLESQGPKDGKSKDPRSIGGSDRFKYLI